MSYAIQTQRRRSLHIGKTHDKHLEALSLYKNQVHTNIQWIQNERNLVTVLTSIEIIRGGRADSKICKSPTRV